MKIDGRPMTDDGRNPKSNILLSFHLFKLASCKIRDIILKEFDFKTEKPFSESLKTAFVFLTATFYLFHCNSTKST